MTTTYKPKIDQPGDYVYVKCDQCAWRVGSALTVDAYDAEIRHYIEDHAPDDELSPLGAALIHELCLQEADANRCDPYDIPLRVRTRCGCSKTCGLVWYAPQKGSPQ